MKQEQIKEEAKCTCKEHDPYCCQVHGSCPTCVKQEKPKQETRKNRLLEEQIEEAAEKYVEGDNNNRYYNDFIAGAKYQAENMYSEEDMIEFGEWMKTLSLTISGFVVKDAKTVIKTTKELLRYWIEQFKKKK